MVLLVASNNLNYNTNGLTGAKKSFTLTTNGLYQMDALVDAPITWPENSINNIRVNITATSLPKDNFSAIYILSIVYQLVPQSERGKNTSVGATIPIYDQKSKFINRPLLNTTTTVSYVEGLTAPTSITDFILRIQIFAYTAGNVTQDVNNSPSYTIYFPDSGTIFVQRPQAQALINLYGFPPSVYLTYFASFAGIVGIIFLAPGVVGIVVEFRDDRRKRKLSKLEVTNEIGGNGQ